MFKKKPNFSLSVDILSTKIEDMKYKLGLIISFIILSGCSASYEELQKTQIDNPQNLNEYLIKEYKDKAEYEAEYPTDFIDITNSNIILAFPHADNENGRLVRSISGGWGRY